MSDISEKNIERYEDPSGPSELEGQVITFTQGVDFGVTK
jgi:hypothetical protein